MKNKFENECDIIHNMCGWHIQFNANNHIYSIELDGVTDELQACMMAHAMGFDRMQIWEYEQHVKDVCIPKETLGKQEGIRCNGNGMHLRGSEVWQRNRMRVTRSSNGSHKVSASA